MAQVTLPYTLTAGSPENVNNLMSNLNALKDGVNTIDTAQIAAGAVTDAKLATALADNLGITNGGNTRRANVTATTERSTTGGYTDVTGASLTLTIPSNSVILVALSCEMKNGTGWPACARVVAGSATIAPNFDSGVGFLYLVGSSSTTYSFTGGVGSVHSAVSGTGSQTIKVQFAAPNQNFTNTAYIKNVYLQAFALTY